MGGRGSSKDDPEMVLYTRARCHLCDEFKEVLVKLRKQRDFQYSEVDIDQDEALCKQYNEDIPVLFINGCQAFQYRIDPEEFLRVYDREREASSEI